MEPTVTVSLQQYSQMEKELETLRSAVRSDESFLFLGEDYYCTTAFYGKTKDEAVLELSKEIKQLKERNFELREELDKERQGYFHSSFLHRLQIIRCLYR